MLQRNNNSTLLKEYAGYIFKLMTQTETDSPLPFLKEIKDIVTCVAEKMTQETQKQTETIISAFEELSEKNHLNFNEIIECSGKAKSEESAVNQISIKIDNSQKLLKKLIEMLGNRNHTVSLECTKIIQRVPTTLQVIQNERAGKSDIINENSDITQGARTNMINLQESSTPTDIIACKDQAETSTTNLISEMQTEGKSLNSTLIL